MKKYKVIRFHLQRLGMVLLIIVLVTGLFQVAEKMKAASSSLSNTSEVRSGYVLEVDTYLFNPTGY